MLYKTVIRLLGVARNPTNGFPARLLASLAFFIFALISCTGNETSPSPAVGLGLEEGQEVELLARACPNFLDLNFQAH